jgi:hypothetical protein
VVVRGAALLASPGRQNSSRTVGRLMEEAGGGRIRQAVRAGQGAGCRYSTILFGAGRLSLGFGKSLGSGG